MGHGRRNTQLLTIILALITVYMPIIPFDNIVSIWKEGSKVEFCFLIIASLLFVGAIIVTIIAFIKLIAVIKPHEYQHVSVEDIAKTETLKMPEDEVEKALCVHYYELITGNSGINDGKAEKIGTCFVLTIIVFMALLCSALILLII